MLTDKRSVGAQWAGEEGGEGKRRGRKRGGARRGGEGGRGSRCVRDNKALKQLGLRSCVWGEGGGRRGEWGGGRGEGDGGE